MITPIVRRISSAPGRDAAAITAAAILSALTQWLIVVAIARIEGPLALGYFSFSQAIIIPVSYLAWISSRQQILATKAMADVQDHVLLRMILPLISFSFVFVVLVYIFARIEIAPYLFAAIVMKYAEGFFDIWSAILQREGKSLRMLKVTVLRVIPANIVLVVIYRETSDIVISSLISLVCMLATSIFIGGRSAKDLLSSSRLVWLSVSIHRILRLMYTSYPLAFANLLMSLAPAGLRLIVEYRFDAQVLGYYSAINQFVTLGSLVQTAYGQSILPSLAEYSRQRNWKGFWRVQVTGIGLMLTIGVIATMTSYLLGAEVLSLIYGNAYVSYHSFLVAMAGAASIQYAAGVVGVGAFAMHLRKAMLANYCLVALIMLSSAYFFAELAGIFCIPIAMALAGVCQIIIFAATFRRSQIR